jgi:predicted kinase
MLARDLGAAHLDKDSLTHGAIGELLVHLGGSATDRESELYHTTCRPLEHATLMSAAINIARNGVPVIVDAPLTKEIRDHTWYDQTTKSLESVGATPVVVLLDAPHHQTLDRIIARGAPRDAGKLTDWESYTQRLDSCGPVVIPHTVITNDGTLAELETKVATLAAVLSAHRVLSQAVSNARELRLSLGMQVADVATSSQLTLTAIEAVETGDDVTLSTAQRYIDAVSSMARDTLSDALDAGALPLTQSRPL